jgi:hypothetical protein
MQANHSTIAGYIWDMLNDNPHSVLTEITDDAIKAAAVDGHGAAMEVLEEAREGTFEKLSLTLDEMVEDGHLTHDHVGDFYDVEAGEIRRIVGKRWPGYRYGTWSVSIQTRPDFPQCGAVEEDANAATLAETGAAT